MKTSDAPQDQVADDDDDDDAPQEQLAEAVASAPMFSDEYLALNFVSRRASELRYVKKWNEWLKYDGCRWSFDDNLRVYTLARAYCRDTANSSNKKGAGKEIASAKTVANVVSLSRSDQRIVASVDQWDVDQWLLNTPRGVVDIRTGEMREHRPDDYFTKCTAVSPGGDCPRWLTFMDEITAGDVDFQKFIQRMFGYCLCGSNEEEALFFCYGEGQNGKGVLINTVSGILKDYHENSSFETFTVSEHGDRHPTELAKLRGARLVTVPETEEGKRWSEARIKTITGGDPVDARFMRQDWFTYTPQFKLVISGNNRPSLSAVNKAIQRRVNMLPFNVIFPDDERDKKLKEKLKAEWPGILAWMIEGALEWQRTGLKPPPIVQAATKDYLNTEDKLGRWIGDCIDLTKPDAFTSSTDLFKSWSGWAQSNGELVGSRTRLVKALKDRGYKHAEKENANGFQGMELPPFSDGTLFPE